MFLEIDSVVNVLGIQLLMSAIITLRPLSSGWMRKGYRSTSRYPPSSRPQDIFLAGQCALYPGFDKLLSTVKVLGHTFDG